MSAYINWNGAVVEKERFCIGPDNRSFRYGDGFFETMKVKQGTICLEALHFERLFSSLRLLRFEAPPQFAQEYLRQQIDELLEQNRLTETARVRLMIYRGDGSVYDPENHHPNFLIQSWPLPQKQLQPPLQIGIFRDARKACDLFSSVKSNNYLCYLMGALHAKQEGLDDALILNAHGRIADATIANVFIVQKDGVVKTPPLSEGCIAGVYRKFLLQSFVKDNIRFVEEPLPVEELRNASEVFLTNAVTGIRCVEKCADVKYVSEVSKYLKGRYESV